MTFRPGIATCSPPYRPGIAELDESGNSKLSFGSEGRAGGEVSAAAPEPDGSFIVMEPDRSGKSLRAKVKRLQPDGAPDPGFGQGGSASLVVHGGDRTALSDVAVDPAGQVLVGGSIAPEHKRSKHRKRSTPLRSWLLLERLTLSGQPDGTFGSGGRITPRFKALMVGPPALLIDQQGRALLGSRYRGRKHGVEGLVVVRFVFAS